MSDVDIAIDLKGEISIMNEMSSHLRRQVQELLRQTEEGNLPEGAWEVGMEYLIEALGEIKIIDQNADFKTQLIESNIDDGYREDISEDYGFEFCDYCRGFKWEQGGNLCFICQEEMK